MRTPVTLAPGETVTLRYAYGMAHARAGRGARGQVPRRRRPARREPAEVGATGCRAPTSARDDRWVARELAWDAYLLRTASVYEEECGAPHDHAGRLLPVHARLQPRLPQLAALPAADRLHRAGARARDPALLDQAAARGYRRASSRTAPGRCARASTSARRTTSTSGCCSPPASTASARATRSSSTSSCRSTTPSATISRVGAHQARLPPPGVDEGPERRLHHGRDRRLVGLRDAARPDDRVDCSSRAQLAYAYPKLAELAELRGDDAFAAQLRARARRAARGARRELDRQGLVRARLRWATARSARA